jgi:predicted SnoaL-like aldol condensation-catalyzing enzyme
MGKIDNAFRDRVLLVGALALLVIFLLDFFRINLTNNVTIVVVIGTGIVVIMYIHKTIKKSENST